MREPVMPNEPPRTSLMAPEAAAAAASSVGSLLRTLASERQQVQVRSGGPTLEDLVREEMRPILKQWLDVNLPPLVERLVRAEIERVVGRAMS
jgi:cell pole-organizing protein PopZ